MADVTLAELAKELGFWPPTAKGWAWGWRRCGRYQYERCLAHTTNPDHLVPSAPSLTNVPPLQIAQRYARGPRRRTS
jgi:hypothetical protein